MRFSEIFEELVTRHTLGGVASEVGVDISQLSRFRSGQGGISMATLEKIFEIAGIELTTKGELERLACCIDFLTDSWRRGRARGRGGFRRRSCKFSARRRCR